MHGRRIYHARGKVLGGSSSINGQIFQRGNPLDYERWAADPGMATWDYAHCLPYFKRMETCLAAAPDDPWRGHDGPLVLERGPATNPLFTAFFASVAGGRLPADRRTSTAIARRASPRSTGTSTAAAGCPRRGPTSIRSWASGKNLTVRTRRVRDAGAVRGRAGGRRGDRERAAAPSGSMAGEVILAGGAINTPAAAAAVGRRAGRRPARRSGSRSSRDLPGVGEHLQDHLEVYIQYKSLQPVSMQPAATQKWRRPFIGAQWLFLRSGPGRDQPLRGRRLRPLERRRRLPEPDVPLPAARDPLRRHRPARRGTATRSTSGRCTPTRAARSRSRARTRASTRRCASTTSRPTRTGASGSRPSASRGASSASRRWRRTTAARRRRAPRVETDDEILEWVRRDAETALHPSCTARMGVDELSVIDPLTMRVHGVDGLRVVDASAMPYVTNGNIYAPVMMLAEKAADLIAGNTPLPPRSRCRSTGTGCRRRRSEIERTSDAGWSRALGDGSAERHRHPSHRGSPSVGAAAPALARCRAATGPSSIGASPPPAPRPAKGPHHDGPRPHRRLTTPRARSTSPPSRRPHRHRHPPRGRGLRHGPPRPQPAFDRRPALIVKAASAADVARTVVFARDAGLELAVRGGSHSLAGYGTSDGGIVLDLERR